MVESQAEHPVQVVQVVTFPPFEYVPAEHFVHVFGDELYLYPASHNGHLPLVESQDVHPVHVVQTLVAPVEYVFDVHDLQD